MEKKLATKQPSTARHNIESSAIYIALAGGVIGFVTGMMVFQGHIIPLFAGKQGSLGLVAIFLATIISFVIYVFASYVQKPNALTKLSTWALAVTHAVLAFITYALMFYIIGEAFKGARIDVISSATIVAISSGFIAYVTYISAFGMNTLRMAALLAIFLVTGIFVSMLTAHDPNWWQYNFSALGKGAGISGETFNYTLILAGMVAVSLAGFLALDLKVLKKSGSLSPKTRANVVRFGLAGIGIALACVGIFVVDAQPLLHVISATGMTVIFGGMIIAVPWIVPNFPKAFYIASYLLLVALVAAAWLFMGVGYFNLTVLEMIAFGIIFTWLILLVRNVSAMLDDQSRALSK